MKPFIIFNILNNYIILNHNDISAIEKKIDAIFDEHIVFKPKKYKVVMNFIFTSPFIKRSDKIRIINKFILLGIKINILSYWMVPDNVIYHYININDLEMIKLIMNMGYKFTGEFLVHIFKKNLNLGFIHWFWDHINKSDGTLKNCLIEAIRNKSEKHINYLLDVQKLDIAKISKIKGISIMRFLIINNYIELAERLLACGLNIDNDISMCLIQCIVDTNYIMMNILVNNIIKEKYELNLKTRYIADHIIKYRSFEILEIILKILSNDDLIIFLYKLSIVKCFDVAYFISLQIKPDSNIQPYFKRMICLLKSQTNRRNPLYKKIYDRLIILFPDI